MNDTVQHKTRRYLSFLLLSISIFGCGDLPRQEIDLNDPTAFIEAVEEETRSENFFIDYAPMHQDGDMNVVVEIPAGTMEKWELSKETGNLELEEIDGRPRIVQYLGYPGNYGMVPRTLLPKEGGGDGDPIDVLVLGTPVSRGEVVKCKLLGVLKLKDRGESDDKLIAAAVGSPMYKCNDLEDLERDFEGGLEIIELWFKNYKGPGKMESMGYQDKVSAMIILRESLNAYSGRKITNETTELEMLNF